jgi:hypothetical protein
MIIIIIIIIILALDGWHEASSITKSQKCRRNCKTFCHRNDLALGSFAPLAQINFHCSRDQSHLDLQGSRGYSTLKMEAACSFRSPANICYTAWRYHSSFVLVSVHQQRTIYTAAHPTNYPVNPQSVMWYCYPGIFLNHTAALVRLCGCHIYLCSQIIFIVTDSWWYPNIKKASLVSLVWEWNHNLDEIKGKSADSRMRTVTHVCNSSFSVPVFFYFSMFYLHFGYGSV